MGDGKVWVRLFVCLQGFLLPGLGESATRLGSLCLKFFARGTAANHTRERMNLGLAKCLWGESPVSKVLSRGVTR